MGERISISLFKENLFYHHWGNSTTNKSVSAINNLQVIILSPSHLTLHLSYLFFYFKLSFYSVVKSFEIVKALTLTQLQVNLICSWFVSSYSTGLQVKISTPQWPYGGLHMARNSDHMEYSIWHQKVTIRSTPCGTFLMPHGVLENQPQMTISIYIAIWSTPYGYFLMPYGVLYKA